MEETTMDEKYTFSEKQLSRLKLISTSANRPTPFRNFLATVFTQALLCISFLLPIRPFTPKVFT